MQIPARIWAKVDQSEPCWKWLGSHTADGRPQVTLKGRPWYVYRLLYTAEIEPIPEGLTLDHVICQHGWCCNPHHCEPVTNSVNIRRALAIRYAGRTACPSGHPYEKYRRYYKNGKRARVAYCAVCAGENVKKWKRAKRAARQ